MHKHVHTQTRAHTQSKQSWGHSSGTKGLPTVSLQLRSSFVKQLSIAECLQPGVMTEMAAAPLLQCLWALRGHGICKGLVHYKVLGAGTPSCPSCPVDVVRCRDTGTASTPHSRGPRDHCPATHRHLSLWRPTALFDPRFSVCPQTLLSADHIVIATGGRPRYPTQVSALLCPLPGPSTPFLCHFPCPFPGLPESTVLKRVFRPLTWQCLRITHCRLLCPSLPPSVFSCVIQAGSEQQGSSDPHLSLAVASL